MTSHENTILKYQPTGYKPTHNMRHLIKTQGNTINTYNINPKFSFKCSVES